MAPHCCPLTIAFLAGIGCTHAAEMHKQGAASSPASWSRSDWRAHIDEERTHLFPILIAEGFTADVVAFDREHALFLDELAEHGEIVSIGLLRQHSAREDQLVGTIVERSRARARHARSGVVHERIAAQREAHRRGVRCLETFCDVCGGAT